MSTVEIDSSDQSIVDDKSWFLFHQWHQIKVIENYELIWL